MEQLSNAGKGQSFESITASLTSNIIFTRALKNVRTSVPASRNILCS